MKIIRTLLMFRGHAGINFAELDADEWYQIDNHPSQYQIFVIDGHTAKILVATEDFTLKRSDALKTASTFVYGQYVKISIDLKRLEGQLEKGVPLLPFHPPY